jgi:threonine dehydrogenase-like Zn-dependent dehydrogenase
MKAALLYGPHDFRIEEKTTPEINDDEYLIGIKACGVCHSEIHQWDEKVEGLDYPRSIGHEAAGIILKKGKKVKNFNEGDKVALWIDGFGYAEEVKAKENRIFPINNNIPFYEALAEPISCTTNAVLKSGIRLNDTIVLVGTGFMGLILLQQLKLCGPKTIIAIDIRDEMLSLASELGADVLINPKKEDYIKKVKELTNGNGADVSFEIGGVQSTLDMVPEITRMEGKIVIFGYHPGKRIINHLGFWNWMAFDIVNAHFRNMDVILNGSRIGMEMLNQGKIKMDKLITHKYPLNGIEEAFTAAKEKPKNFVKSVLVMEN